MSFDESFNVFQSKKDRIKAIFLNGDFADCSFVIDQREIRAHKLILTLSSPVFEKMFYGNLASSRIEITDIGHEDFRKMLEFVYNDLVFIQSVPEAWNLFYIAQKYIMHDLADVCSTYIEKNLTISNLVMNYEYADMYGIEQLKAKCMQDITDYVRGVFLHLDGYQMKASTLAVILSQTALAIGNDELVIKVLEWTICELSNEVTPGCIIDYLKQIGVLKYLVRLELRTDFSRYDSIFSQTVQQIKQLQDQNQILFRYSPKHWCTICKHRQVYKIAHRAKLRANDCIASTISVNRRVLLFGIGVSNQIDGVAASNHAECNSAIRVEIISACNETVLHSTVQKGKISLCEPIFVRLETPTILECDKKYTVRIYYRNLNEYEMISGNTWILCKYMSNKLVDEKRKTIFSIEEVDGGVIEKLSYYLI